jgi:hypothetical protein
MGCVLGEQLACLMNVAISTCSAMAFAGISATHPSFAHQPQMRLDALLLPETCPDRFADSKGLIIKSRRNGHLPSCYWDRIHLCLGKNCFDLAPLTPS